MPLPAGWSIATEETATPAPKLPAGWSIAEQPGAGESAARGALQGATASFGDELAAGIDTLVSKVPGVRTVANAIAGDNAGGGLPLTNPDLTYAERRDAYRTKNAQAQGAHPVAYGAGEVGGALATSLIPGVAPARGAGLAAQAGRAAVQGGVSALGASEADLTKGEFGQAAIDTGVGTVVGGATGAFLGKVGRYLTGGAEKRALGQLQTELTRSEESGSISQGLRKKVAGDLADIRDTLEKPENAKIAKLVQSDPEKAAAAIVKRQAELAKDAKAPLYKALDQQVGGYNTGPLRTRIQSEIAALSTDPGHGSERAALGALLRDIDNTWGKVPKLVPTAKLREFTTIAQGAADKSLRGLDPSVANPIKRRVAGVVEDALKQHLEISEQLYPQLKPVVTQILAYNTENSALANMRDALTNMAIRDKTGTASMGKLFEAATGKVAHTAGAVASLATGNPAPLLVPLALKAGAAVAGKTAASANVALSKLVRAAAAGSATAQMVQDAIEAGVPRATALAAAKMTETDPTAKAPPAAPSLPAPLPPLPPSFGSGVPLAGR